ncbi:LOW QUALITY PROTEIN: hypothetical protein TorRG33x02_140660 [Trema orientale]|uniref:Uncharacterized protein n=1 Tax=Trema orientale TaxID=63057 RepID=A0A2P5EXF6_TREOI|nr:LOW QUALITY PROTEIN: hypothetical protein TorRG33x02_140660 [Trema orientale]
MNKEGIQVGPSNVVVDTIANVGTLPSEKGNDIPKDNLEPFGPHSQEKDSSSFQESTNDSLNTSDLSPTKVFTSRDEGWQEVQSKKKKKASQAQFTRPFTRSSKNTSQ